MAISRDRKSALLTAYTEQLRKSVGVVVTEYKGLSVAQIGVIRGKLGDVGGKYVVTKNTVFLRALKNAGWPDMDSLMTGQTAVVFGGENFPTVAKALMDLLKDYEQFLSVKGGAMGNALLKDKAQVEIASNLPSLDVLRAQIAGLIAQPAAGIVNAINGAVVAVPQVLQAYVAKHDAA